MGAREEGSGEGESWGALGQNSAERIGPILLAIRVSAMAPSGRSAISSFVEFEACGCDDHVLWTRRSEQTLASSVERPTHGGFATKRAIGWFCQRLSVPNAGRRHCRFQIRRRFRRRTEKRARSACTWAFFNRVLQAVQKRSRLKQGLQQ